ncbi:TPA: restriction endonuclease [Klebsiella variicola]
MIATVLWLMAVFLIMAGIILACRRRPGARERRHARYRRRAGRILDKLPGFTSDGQRLAFLRQVDPYVTEEVVLLAFARRGLRTGHNTHYSGDGGMDGEVWIDGERWLLQVKRWRRAISPAHVRRFATLLQRRRAPGMFIHTGRTGPASRQAEQSTPRLYIVSGSLLLRLLNPDIPLSAPPPALHPDKESP